MSEITHKNTRFHLPHAHLASAFGDDWFALKAEAFARFFGTPVFLIGQTVIVAVWILLNVTGIWVFDIYPFILLAQTRQADRDKCTTLADAQHREELHTFSEQRQRSTAEQTALLVKMLEQNTAMTEANRAMSARIEHLTIALHNHIMEGDKANALGTPAPAAPPLPQPPL